MSPNLVSWDPHAPTGKKSDLCRNENSAFDLMPPSVTVGTKRNQIFRCIMAELTSGIKMMDLQHFCGTAILASPSIPTQDLNLERLVAHQIQF
jgi:hypothetical protein